MTRATTIIPAREFVPPKSLVAVQTAAGVEYYKGGTEPAVAPSPNVDTAAGPETVSVLRGGTDDQEVIAGDLPGPGPNSYPVYGFRSPDDAELGRDLPPKRLSPTPAGTTQASIPQSRGARHPSLSRFLRSVPP